MVRAESPGLTEKRKAFHGQRMGREGGGEKEREDERERERTRLGVPEHE